MKIFNRDGKINFIDENNVLVGFDYRRSCCEDFGYFFARKADTVLASAAPHPSDDELADYRFDQNYFDTKNSSNEYGGGSSAIFRLINEKNPSDEYFLILYNSHNGYYAHGFSMEVGGQQIQSGYL